MSKTPKEILSDMRAWWDVPVAPSVAERDERQRGWDSALLAAAEYIRRRMDYDETLSLELLELVSTRRKPQPTSPHD